ncbi:hypothetical protein BH11PSE10_BH11PSE10_12070 [soil metagenome]
MKLNQSLIFRATALSAMVFLASCGGGGGGDYGGGVGIAPVKLNAVTNAPSASCSAAGIAASTASTASATVCMLTSDGEVVVELYADKAPLSVANFLKYVADGFYTNTAFHRLVRDFVVQGGGYATGATYSTGGAGKTATYAAIKLESNNGLSNLRGTLAMARTSAADSATSQFYFNAVNNTGLDYSAAVGGANGYAVFGKVISGLATIDKINVEPRWASDPDIPATEVILYWAQRLK